MEIFPAVENILLVVALTAQASQTWADREDPDVSAIQDRWLAKPTTASAAPLNQIAVAGIVALLGVSCMFNSTPWTGRYSRPCSAQSSRNMD